MNVMLQHQNSIFEICEILSEQENLTVTFKEASKGALMVGMCAFAGALLGGPVGLAIGGTVSSVAVACSSKEYKSVIDILRNDITPAQKQRLITAVMKILDNFKVEDCATVLTMVMTSTTLKEAIIKELGNFLLKELNYHIIKKDILP